MFLVLVSWTLLTSPSLWNKFDLECILVKERGSVFFIFIGQFRYLGIQVLPHEFVLENVSVNVEFLENKTREITNGTHLLSIAEIVNGV